MRQNLKITNHDGWTERSRSRDYGNPAILGIFWMPAFAGMTDRV
jgi:hypothetical protein